MKKLQLAEGLTLSIDVVTEKLAWLGRTGSGKTYGAMKLAELMLEQGAQIGAIDPVGVWQALRVPAKRGGVSFPVYVFGGLYADLPLQPTMAAGALVADLVSDRGISFVLDVSQMIPGEQQDVVRGFVDRFFHRRKAAPAAVHLFMEECQEFIPENPSGKEAFTLGVMQRMWKLGRNFGIGGSLISQRPQEIAKKALNMSGTLFAFQMTGPQERDAVKKWVADHGVAADIVATLQKLPQGEPHVESPSYLGISRQVRILPRVTADLSSTPKVGAAAAPAKRSLTPIDVEQLQTAMAATIEEAKANDPRELKKQLADKDKQIRELEAKCAKAPTTIPANIPAARSVPALTDADRALLEKLTARLAELESKLTKYQEAATNALDDRLFSAFASFIESGRDRAAAHTEEMKGLLESASVKKLLEKLSGLAQVPQPAPSQPHTRKDVARIMQVPERLLNNPVTPTEGISGVGQRILNALAELEQLGSKAPARELVAFMSNYTNLTSKGFTNGIGSLRTAGLIAYPSEGIITLTEDGRKAAQWAEAPSTPAQVQARVIGLLGGASGKILDPLIKAYPNALPRDVVAAKAGYGNLTSKGFTNAIGRLRSLGFIDYPDKGAIVAKPVLFLEA